MAFDRDQQQATDADQALALLRDGNKRFLAGDTQDHDLLAQVSATASGQFPFVAFLGCIDSRVPVELVFDLGIGDAFVTRVAGNVVNDDVLGSLEFATAVAGAQLVVVLGHTSCGAVGGACDGVELGHLTGLLGRIRPAVLAAADGGPIPGSDDPAFVDAVVRANVDNVVDALQSRSQVLHGLVDDGRLRVVGAVHDITSGAVEFLD